MNTQPDPIDLGPPLVIGCIMIAVGLTLPFIALWWMGVWCYRWAIKKEPRERG
jgi:hypothetical protein